MAELTFSKDEVKMIVDELVKQLIPEIRKEIELVNQLPPLLTRKQFMDLVEISSTKCNELFNRADFPVTRELGHPRVVTAKFFEWLEEDLKNRKLVILNRPYYQYFDD